MLKIAFHGAAREVTGSCHLVETDHGMVLLDCGLIQGGKERHERNREPFPFNPAKLKAVVLSHAHIDHSGRLAVLRKAGFRGPIYTTDASAELCKILLADSGHIQEEDARWKIKRLKKAGKDWNWVEPLYTQKDATEVCKQLERVPFNKEKEIPGIGAVRFIPAGHILGAAIVELNVRTAGGDRRIVFSGDLGVEGGRLMGQPQPAPRPDYLIMESTYGNRSRKDGGDRTEELFQIVSKTVSRGGKVIIPSFAVGRSQELIARLNDLVEAGRLENLPVFLDSPMAVRATEVFEDHPEAWSEEARALDDAGDAPLEFPGLRLTRSVEESKDLNQQDSPAVIISASGMCTAGRIKHHLKYNISDPASTILFVGYQAVGSLGRIIQSGVNPVRIFGEMHTVQADIATIEGFSAHADREELLQWFENLEGPPTKTFVVHGEEEACLALGDTLRERYGVEVEVPEKGEVFVLD